MKLMRLILISIKNTESKIKEIIGKGKQILAKKNEKVLMIFKKLFFDEFIDQRF